MKESKALHPVSVDEEEDAVYWRNHVSACGSSGLSQSEYCREHNLNYNRFRDRKRKYCGEESGNKVSSLTLVQVGGEFNVKSVGGGLGSGSGIRFWLGDLCIEVDEGFSSGCLSELVETLRRV